MISISYAPFWALKENFYNKIEEIIKNKWLVKVK